MAGVLHNSLNFLYIAVRNADVISTSSSLEPNHEEALITIVFAASALEAFINERIEMASMLCEISQQPSTVHDFSRIMTDPFQKGSAGRHCNQQTGRSNS